MGHGENFPPLNMYLFHGLRDQRYGVYLLKLY